MHAKIQIQIVTHNSMHHLERLFAGINKQAGVDASVLVIDNASTDGTVEWVREHHPKIRIIQNKDNRGFSRAHNQGFAECQSKYSLVLNPDVVMQEGCLAEMVKVMEEPPPSPLLNKGGGSCVAAVTPKLYKVLPNGQKSGIIDSLGLWLFPWGQVVNIGENEPESAKFGGKESVWGVSGACAFYRIKALEAVKDEHGIFDERFWMYKEDADLSWRLNRAGFESRLAPKAVADHQRTVERGKRSTRLDRVNRESYKNHVLMLRKNLSWSDWWRLPLIVAYEFAKLVYILLFERHLLRDD